MQTADWIRERGAHLVDLAEPLQADVVANATAVAKALSESDAWDEVIEIGESEPAEIRERLRSLGIADQVPATLIWASSQHGVALAFGEFVRWYDVWWYPSSDDVWVLDPNDSWLIELDHEEILRFRSPQQPPDRRSRPSGTCCSGIGRQLSSAICAILQCLERADMSERQNGS